MAKSEHNKRPSDPNQLAHSVLQDAIAASEQIQPTGKVKKKNMAAFALSQLGAAKGGKARAASLSAMKRKQIARKAAKTRWKSHRPKK
jgi:hypothetical protein